MLKGLKVLNLPASHSADLSPEVKEKLETGHFVLKTCQRHLYMGFHNLSFSSGKEELGNKAELHRGSRAYDFLLEIICGLQSQLVGENEIVAQFKEAYQNYLRQNHRNPHVMTVLEKLFQDAKKVRSQYLKEIGQYSYSGLAKKLLQQNHSRKKVAIVGSGQLCLDLLKVLSKRYDIHVCARNRKKVEELSKQFNFTPLAWEAREQLKNYSAIINTVGAENTVLFSEDFFNQWSPFQQSGEKGLFIDLGSPSVLDTELSISDGVYRLTDIFAEGSRMNEIKEQKVTKARDAIQELTKKRAQTFGIHFPYGWEELQFV